MTQMMVAHMAYAPQTFAIGMRSEGAAIETRAAQRAAAEIGVPLDSTVLEDEDFVDRWPSLLAQFGEPIANSSSLLIQLICERVGDSHKVALCGQGADELLGGYSRHMTERLYRLGRLWPSMSRLVTRAALGTESEARLARALSSSDQADRHAQIFSVLPLEEVDRLVRGASASAAELARAAIARWLPADAGRDPVNDFLRVDVRLSLADDLLIVADHCAMRSSVELRVPFLDLAFVELIERMPSRYKVSLLGERKWLYRRAAAHHLPPDLARRLCPPTKRFVSKRGFSQPLANWFGSEGGLLAEHARWTDPLLDLPEFAPDRLKAALGPVGMSGFTRRRSVLYALARWLEANGHAAPAPAR
jgi:asparagine synthase (glutamine-hydrolysing)